MQPIHLYYRKSRAVFIAVFYSLFLGLFLLCLVVDAPNTSRTVPLLLSILVLVLLAPAAQTAVKTLRGKPIYTIDELGISYFASQVLIPWQQIVSIAIYSPEQTNDKTWKLYIKMAEGYHYPSNWWMRINIKNNRRISHGQADFIIIASYLSSSPQQIIEAILSTYKQYKK